jgi:PAS domain S-box-containing protein
MLGAVRRLQPRTVRRRFALLAPLLLLGMLLASFALWDGLRQKETAQRMRALDVVAHNLAGHVETRIAERVAALTRMAERWEVTSGTPRALWEADAAGYVRDMPGTVALEWLDPAGQVRWVVPLAGNQDLVGTYPNRDRVRLAALDAAREQPRSVLSAPVTLIQSGEGVLVFRAVRVRGQLVGFLASAIRIQPMMTAIPERVVPDGGFALEHAGRVVYRSAPLAQAGAAPAARAPLSVGDGRWTVAVWPGASVAAREPLSNLLLGAGLGGTLLMAGVLWFWRLALLHAAETSQLAHIVAHTTNAVILTDAAGRVEWVNEGFVRITGYTLAEVRGRKPGDVLQGPDTDGATVERIRARLARGESLREEILNYAKDGRPYWLDMEIQPVGFDQGVPTGFMAIEADITERKRAEQSLQETRNFLETVIDNLPVMLFVKEAKDLRFVTLNRAGEELLGLRREQLYGKHDHDFFPPEQAEFFVARDREVLAAGSRIEVAEEPIDTPTGRRLLHTIEVPINDVEGRPIYLLGISTDITESRKIERMKAEFISTVSHELRTPLTSIRGALGLLAGGVAGPVPEQVRQMLQIALRNSDHLTALINDILDIEKAESGSMSLVLRRQPLAQLLAQALEANLPYAANLGVSLRLEAPVAGVEVSVDAGRFNQVMNNLLSNAAKFSPVGGVVDIRATVRDAAVRIAVSDQGPGIPEEFRERVFHKFSQADASDTRARGGTGLGLAISKSLVEAMGGSIGFESHVGVGTTFYFDLPLATSPVAS